MHAHEITHIYGSGPFGNAGVTQVFVTDTIKGWLDRAKDATGILHDLYTMAPLVWKDGDPGMRRYAAPAIMRRLAALSALTDPRVRLFCGVFPRAKGRPRTQILWWRPISAREVLIGAEEDLDSIDEPIVRHDSGQPSAYPHGEWRGLIQIRL
jgi:hypothetical protein